MWLVDGLELAQAILHERAGEFFTPILPKRKLPTSRKAANASRGGLLGFSWI